MPKGSHRLEQPRCAGDGETAHPTARHSIREKGSSFIKLRSCRPVLEVKKNIKIVIIIITVILIIISRLLFVHRNGCHAAGSGLN